jgi:hypothetical protein
LHASTDFRSKTSSQNRLRRARRDQDQLEPGQLVRVVMLK